MRISSIAIVRADAPTVPPPPLRAEGGTASRADRAGAVEWRSDVLLTGRREVTILHAGERYRLRLTRTNKLILTK